MDFCEYFKNKKITVMGLGVLGRGVGDAKFLAECGADLVVTDLKTESELRESLERLKDFSNITYRLGEHHKEDFENRDLILVAPAAPLESEYLAHAREAGVRLVQSAALFVELSKIPIIGVTGTRGKSTVTHMIHHVLTQATGERIILGGNIRGVSNLQLLKEVKEDSLAVMELDSWQLQGFGWAGISPQIAVFTNFMEDHMNYYGGDMDTYFKDKANIFKYQEESGVFITTPEVFERAQKLTGVTLGQEVVLVDSSVIPKDTLLSMPGEHNRLNAAFAYEALKATSLSDGEIFEGLVSFPGVPGRLEYLKEVDGVKIYNDNNATTPQATVAALYALGEKDKNNIILVMGGADKTLDTAALIATIPQYCKRVVLLPGTGTDKVRSQLENSTVNCINVANLKKAIETARSETSSGDILLFSPAFASFGQFKNEYDRNDQFVEAVQKL